MQVSWQAAIPVEGELASIPTLLPSFRENVLPPAPLHVAAISFFQVNFTTAAWKHPFRGKKPLENHKHPHKALGAGAAFDSGFNFFYVKTQQTSSCVSVSLQSRVSQGLVHTAVSETSCLWTVVIATTNNLCWRRHFCSFFIQEVLSSILVWWINVSHRSGILHFSFVLDVK